MQAFETEHDPKVQDAMRFIGPTCTRSLGIGQGYCDKPVSVGVLERKNLVCDRVLVGTCEDGHDHHAAIIDES